MNNLSADSPARRWLVPAFFFLLLIVGLSIYRDYGVSIDEYQSRLNGMVTLKHVGEKIAPFWIASHPDFAQYNVPLEDYYDRDYGVAFETPVSFLEQVFEYNDIGDKFRFRHLCTFLVCFGGVIAVYQLATRRFRDWRLGLLAALWLVLSPRLFAEAFFNDKDAVFMALFAMATNSGIQLLVRPNVRRALWHALFCALTIDVRIMGVLIPLATVALLFWRGVRSEVGWRRVLGISALFLVVGTGLMVAMWPYLWPAPLDNFVAAFQKMSSFRWSGNVLYFGNFVPATDLPWHYALGWILATTPPLYILSGLLGLGLIVGHLVQNRWHLWKDDTGMQDVFFLGLFAGPLLAVIALHSVLYDGWRQLFFVYPTFMMIAIRGWVAAARWRPRWRWWPRAVYGLTVLSALLTAAQMVRDHPFQNVYFSVLAGTHVAERFEMDYWGLGFRKDLEYIVTHETRPVIKVMAPPPTSAEHSSFMLPPYQRDRIQFVPQLDSADYFLANYRWHPEPYEGLYEVFQIRADGRRIHSVFRLR